MLSLPPARQVGSTGMEQGGPQSQTAWAKIWAPLAIS